MKLRRSVTKIRPRPFLQERLSAKLRPFLQKRLSAKLRPILQVRLSAKLRRSVSKIQMLQPRALQRGEGGRAYWNSFVSMAVS